MQQVYLDHNATTPVDPAVLEAMLPYFADDFGNPSSGHWAGAKAQQALVRAREQVAALMNCHPTEVIFTSCATEANNMAILGVAGALRERGNHIITTTVEHPSVLAPCMFLEQLGFRITCLGVDSEGMLDLDALERAFCEQTILVSAMYANNETGTIFPVAAIAEAAARHNAVFHCDAVQAVGKVPVDWRGINAGLLSMSAHKLYGPKGVGALIMRKGVRMLPFIHGGRQERNRRAGTENVAGIVGMGKACEIAGSCLPDDMVRISALRDRLEAGILSQLASVRLNGHPVKRVPGTSNISFAGLAGDDLLAGLNRAGIAVSSGSACTSGALTTSHVIKALGLDESVQVSPIRFSLGRTTSDDQVDYVLEQVLRLVRELRGA